MERNKKSTPDEMRVSLRNFYLRDVPDLIANLQKSADELDATYKAIKFWKAVGYSIYLAAEGVGVGVFVTSFTASPTPIEVVSSGAAFRVFGVTIVGLASIFDLVKAKRTRDNVEEKLDKFKKAFGLVLGKCIDISDKLEPIGHTYTAFPSQNAFWASIVSAAETLIRRSVVGTKVVVLNADTNTASNTAPGNDLDLAIYISTGATTVVLLPVGAYFLFSVSRELLNKVRHNDSKRIREIVEEIKAKCPTEEKIDDIIDNCR